MEKFFVALRFEWCSCLVARHVLVVWNIRMFSWKLQNLVLQYYGYFSRDSKTGFFGWQVREHGIWNESTTSSSSVVSSPRTSTAFGCFYQNHPDLGCHSEGQFTGQPNPPDLGWPLSNWHNYLPFGWSPRSGHWIVMVIIKNIATANNHHRKNVSTNKNSHQVNWSYNVHLLQTTLVLRLNPRGKSSWPRDLKRLHLPQAGRVINAQEHARVHQNMRRFDPSMTL